MPTVIGLGISVSDFFQGANIAYTSELLLESGDRSLLESGDYLLLEA